MRYHHRTLAVWRRTADAVLVTVMLPMLAMMEGVDYRSEYQVASILAGLLTWVVMGMAGVYRARRGDRIDLELRTVSTSFLVVVGLLLLIGWVGKDTHFFSRLVVGSWLVSSYVGILLLHLGTRLGLRWLRRLGHNSRTAIVVGAGPLGRHLIEHIQQADWTGIHIIGCFSDDGSSKHDGQVFGVPVLGGTMDAVTYARENHVDIVYISMATRLEERIRELSEGFHDTTASVYLVPDLFMFDLLHAQPHEVNGVPVFALFETPLTGPFGLVKWLEDKLLASLILLLIWPVLLVIAVLVRLDSPGPVIFRQKRYGLNGDEVEVWKFRSMKVMENGAEVKQAIKGDVRVTRIGAFLRKTSLDELPQFINVLQGRMSVVGPRPHAVVHNEKYRKLIKGYMWRHKMKPGITGWAQVNGWRGETETLEKMQKRVECDLEYIRQWSVWLDLKIVWLTVWKGFTGNNAY